MSNEVRHLGRALLRGHLSRRDFLGRAAALGLTAPAALAILGDVARAQPVKGGTLKLGLQGGAATDSLDPALTTASVMFMADRLWGDTLVALNPADNSPTPWLAESWEASDGAKKWRFKIRSGVTFHDGKALTTDDVVATLRRHSDENGKSGALGIMKTVTGIEKDGDDGVLLTLDSGSADLPSLMADYHLVIQPNGGLDNPSAAIGTGAYKLVNFEAGVRIAFEKNPNYWNADLGHVDAVEILVINDPTARSAALSSGQVHAINRVEATTVGLLSANPNLVVRNVSGAGHYVFIMHCDKTPFDNNDLRLALKYAIDRQEMVDKILAGYGSVGNDFPINASYPLFPEAIEQRAFDPDKAKHHYAKSGHSGPIELKVSDVAFPGALDAATLFQASAAKCGIAIDLKREPGDGYWSNVWNVQPFCASYWGGRPVQDQMYTTAYSSKADWNDTKFFRDDFDKILIEARAELDPARRKEMYTQMAMMVRDEGGAIVPMFNDFIDVTSNTLQGWIEDRSLEMSGGWIAHRCWLTA